MLAGCYHTLVILPSAIPAFIRPLGEPRTTQNM